MVVESQGLVIAQSGLSLGQSDLGGLDYTKWIVDNMGKGKGWRTAE